jgi:hypothetical protein
LLELELVVRRKRYIYTQTLLTYRKRRQRQRRIKKNRVKIYQTCLRINKGQKREKTYITKDNIFAVFVQEKTDKKRKDKESKYKQRKPDKEVKKTPEAPQTRHIKEMF